MSSSGIRCKLLPIVARIEMQVKEKGLGQQIPVGTNNSYYKDYGVSGLFPMSLKSFHREKEN